MDATKKKNLTYWWFPLLFGVIFILIGIWILQSPVESFEKITKIIGVIIVVSGTTQLLFSVSNRLRIPWWGLQAVNGIIDLAIGIILIIYPEILLRIITIFVGVWLIVNSVLIIMKAAEARKKGSAYWKWEVILGILLLLLAFTFFWHPVVIGITVAIWTAMAFIMLGVFRIVLTFRLRKNRSDQVKSPES